MFYLILVVEIIYVLTIRVLVTGNNKARTAPFKQLRCTRKMGVMEGLGGAANK